MWVKLSDKKPPIGNCKKNLLLLWSRCPEDVTYPENYRGYTLGFFDGKLFFDNCYKFTLDNIEYWSCLLEPPTAEQGVANALKPPPNSASPKLHRAVCRHCTGDQFRCESCVFGSEFNPSCT